MRTEIEVRRLNEDHEPHLKGNLIHMLSSASSGGSQRPYEDKTSTNN
jgi:hypothetical protein